MGTPTGITGKTTAGFQAGSLPSGFSSGTWGAKSGFYPYLGVQYPHGAIALSGTAYSDYGTTAVTGAAINLLTNGASAGSTTSDGGGAYALLADSGQDNLVRLSGSATKANTFLQTPTVDTLGVDLYGGYLRQFSAAATTSAIFAGLKSAVGSNTGADFLYTTGGGLVTNTSIGIVSTASGGLSIDGALNSGTGTIVVDAATAVSQTAALTASNLDLIGSGVSFTLTNASNAIGTLAGSTGSLSFLDSTSFSVGTVNGTAGAISSGAVVLRSVGASTDITIASGASVAGVSSSNAVVLSATGAFINNAGSGAVTVSGGGSARWIVYSASSAGDTFGNLDSGAKPIWAKTYATLAPASVAAGKHYVFAESPTVSLAGASFHKDYGTDGSGSLTYTVSGVRPAVSGAYLANSNSDAFTGAPVASSSGAAVTADVVGGGYAINLDQSGVTALNGYTLGSATAGTLTVDPVALTITAHTNTKTYDGDTTAAATPTYSALFNGDTVTGLAETYDTKNAGTGKTLSVSGYTVNDGVGGADYTVSTVDDTTGVISQAALTITAATNTKTYDTDTTAAATPTYTGLQSGDTLTGLTETYDNKNVGTGKTLTVGSGYTLTDGNSGANYTVTTNTDTTGVINKASLTVTANADSKTYDATAYSGGNGVAFSAFAGSETSADLGGTLGYTGSSQGAVNAGTYVITPGATPPPTTPSPSPTAP